MVDSAPSQQDVAFQEILALQQAKNTLDARLKEQLDKAEAEYKKKLATLANKYSKSVISVFDSLNKADFASEKYKLDLEFKSECDFIRSVHNKTYGNTREELQEKLEKRVKNLNYGLKAIVLEHQGELIANVMPSSLASTAEAPKKIVEWFSAMKALKIHSAEERMKLMEQPSYLAAFSPSTEKELQELWSEPQPLKEEGIDVIPDLTQDPLEHSTTMIAFTTNGEKNSIGVFQDQYGIWLYDPGRLTACFAFKDQDPQMVKEKVQQFIKKYQQIAYPTATQAASMSKMPKNTLVDIEKLVQTPAAVLHQREALATKNAGHTFEPQNKESLAKKIKKKKTR